MKIAYLGKIQLSDVDLSYIHAAQKHMDLTYILEITPRFNKGPAFNIDKIYKKSGVFKAIDIYPEFVKYAEFIDINKFYVINTSGHLWQIKAFWTNLLLLFFLLRHKFNVIHIVWPLNIYEFILYFLRRKMIITVHDPFPHTGLDTFIVRLRRIFAFKFILRLIILNTAQRKQFIDYYNLKNKIIINSNLSCYNYLRTINPDISVVPDDCEYILFAGKISPYKGLDYLLPAMKKIHDKYPKIRLIIAGGGKFNFDISEYEKLGYIEIRNRFIPDKEMTGLIRGSMFIVCPYTDATQSGVIMTAFAFAKPVIATNVGGLPEMVENNRFGLIIKEKDSTAIVKAIKRMLNDRMLIKRFSDNIRVAYENGDRSWKKISEALRDEYYKVLEKQK